MHGTKREKNREEREEEEENFNKKIKTSLL